MQKTAGIAGVDNSGSLPELQIKEFEAAKMKAIFPKVVPKPAKLEERMKVFVWDLIGNSK